MSKLKVTTLLITLFALSVSFGLAQRASWDDDGYNSFSPFAIAQTKDTPAGFVNEPGSQLIYLLDTGINAEELYGDQADFGSKSLRELSGGALTSPVHQNYISLTNTNPSHAVTVHFRYFNAQCEDFFDFLVVLTCNDTMMIDPFNFVVPATGGVNVSHRFFGYLDDVNDTSGTQKYDSISGQRFADGRFLLFVTASADPKDGFYTTMSNSYFNPGYHYLDLIPYEFISYREELLSSHCTAWTAGGGSGASGYDAAGEELYGVYNAYGNTGFISDDNLHVLNAAAVSFNYLIGFQTVAKVTDSGAQAAYMTQAYTRPAVVANAGYLYETSITGGPSGVGLVAAPLHALLTGGELINTSWNQQGTTIRTLYDGMVCALRQDAHAGDQWDRGADVVGTNWIISEGGALGWEIFPSGMPAVKQVVNFISFMDNYNGRANFPQGATTWSKWLDLSYNIRPVVTIYTIESFNNSEDPWTPGDPENQPIVSPIDPETPVTSALAVKCISAYQIDPESNLNDAVLGEKFGEFTLEDLFAMNNVTGTNNMDLEGFLGVLDGSDNEKINEVGPGWMRFSRWFTTRKWKPSSSAPYHTELWLGLDSALEPHVEGIYGPSILTAGQANYVFEDFGSGKWLSTVASYSREIAEVD